MFPLLPFSSSWFLLFLKMSLNLIIMRICLKWNRSKTDNSMPSKNHYWECKFKKSNTYLCSVVAIISYLLITELKFWNAKFPIFANFEFPKGFSLGNSRRGDKGHCRVSKVPKVIKVQFRGVVIGNAYACFQSLFFVRGKLQRNIQQTLYI